MLTRSELAGYALDALRSFYDPARLRLNPLIGLLHLREEDGQPSPAALRRTLREAIESLRPDPSIHLNSPIWLPYRILWLRYVQNRGREATCEEIGLSQAAYYRHRDKALAALVDVLWNRYQAIEEPLEPGTEQPPLGAASALDEGLRLMAHSAPHPVDLAELLQSAAEMLEPLARERNVTFHHAVNPSLPRVQGHPTLLRQTFLYLLTDLLNAPGGPDVDISITIEAHEIHVAMRRRTSVAQDLQAFRQRDGVRFGEGILQACHGQLQLAQSSEHLLLCASLPVQESKTILVIDDNADAILLYQRYLEGYHLLSARSEEEVMTALATHSPDLILLDLLMPDKDGWDILRLIKSSPRSAAIPVLVCSVVSQPQLAIAMGAACVLQKPFSQEALLLAVRPLLQSADTMAAPHR
jgi:CheY-like chemotaxis protein